MKIALRQRQKALLEAYLIIYNEYVCEETTMDPISERTFINIIIEYPDFKSKHAKYIDIKYLKKLKGSAV